MDQFSTFYLKRIYNIWRALRFTVSARMLTSQINRMEIYQQKKHTWSSIYSRFTVHCTMVCNHSERLIVRPEFFESRSWHFLPLFLQMNLLEWVYIYIYVFVFLSFLITKTHIQSFLGRKQNERQGYQQQKMCLYKLIIICVRRFYSVVFCASSEIWYHLYRVKC